MRHQQQQQQYHQQQRQIRSSQRRTLPFIVDEDSDIPTSLIDEYRNSSESGPPGPADPRAPLLLSMSEYDKTQSYDQYDYQATRPEQAQDYTSFEAAHPQYTHEYVGTHAQAASNLAHASALPYLAPGAAYSHDPTYYAQAPAYAAAAAAAAASAPSATYLESGPRQLPDIISFTPSQGTQGAKVTIRFQSPYDLEAHPATNIVIMFGHKRCDSVLSKTSLPNSPYEYVLQTTVPPLSSTSSESPQVSLALSLGGAATWQAPRLEVGSFTYLNDYDLESSAAVSRKRKLSDEAIERRSPTKKPSYQELSRSASQHFYSSESPSIVQSGFPRQAVQSYGQPRRFSQPEYNYSLGLPRVQTQQYYTGAQPASATARLQTVEQSPASYDYYSSMPSSAKDTAVLPPARTAQLLPSPAASNPPLIRTSTLHQSPTTTGLPVSVTQSFNPYAMYPANTKAMLKVEGDLNTMVEEWTKTEWEAKRRLVQFQRSQQGSVISTTFAPVTLEERAPNSICVSCIWWQEKQECYVTSVDTIQLLESLVAVRFTVEEKNRIRRNLEGFRPATVSKTKADSEEFFKLIMGFPSPKPRNIEKDVKVFPWRILSTALRKIIGKYSASYSSTAGALHTPAGSSYAAARLADTGVDTRTLASPRSTSSSVASHHGHAYAPTMTSQSYVPHTAAAELSAGPPDLRLSVPHTGQAASWHPSPAQQQHQYGSATTDLSATASSARTPWDYAPPGLAGYGMSSSSSSSQYQYGTARMPSMLGQSQQTSEARFIPLHDYEQHGQPTTSGA